MATTVMVSRVATGPLLLFSRTESMSGRYITVMTTRPREEGPPPPRRPGWGCLAAAIVTAIGLIVVLVLAANLFANALGGVRVR